MSGKSLTMVNSVVFQQAWNIYENLTAYLSLGVQGVNAN